MELLIRQSVNQTPLALPQGPQQLASQFQQRSSTSTGSSGGAPVVLTAPQEVSEVKVEEGKAGTTSSSEPARPYGPTCYNCGQRGHYRNECTLQPNQQNNYRTPWVSNQRRFAEQSQRGRTTAVNAVEIEEEIDPEGSGMLGTRVSVNMVEVLTEL